MKSTTKTKSIKPSKQRTELRPASPSDAPKETAITTISLQTQNSLPVDVALRAYQLWQQDGQAHGNDVKHWLLAEKQVLNEVN